MRYISTRGKAPALGFEDTLLGGLAPDGGLYFPESWPQIAPEQFASWRTASYADIAKQVMAPFVAGSIDTATFEDMVDETYAAFMHKAVAPLKQLDDRVWFMELFHGPTLAFKDYALQLVGRMFDHVLAKRGQRLTVVGATSGDTGSAAIAACAGLENVDITILFPKGRVSPVQQRQMTTVDADNVRCIALEGTFDDCQDRVKDMFNDAAFRAEVGLGAVNSINWGRVMAQIVYYAVAAARLASPERPIDVSVPTGNYGNVLAGYCAKRMGLPIARLGVATNRNDILTRFLEQNDMSIQPVEPSWAPSMDIQISSNFERYLFEAMDRDGAAVDQVMRDFRSSGKLSLAQGVWELCHGDFQAYRLDDAGISSEIKRVADETGEVLDPHSIISVSQAQNDRRFENPVVAMGTAHPAKFPDAVQQAVGQRPGLPPHMAGLFERNERFEVMANDLAALQDFVRANRRS
jgi:threonine synthase